ncbi:hypothetical protein RHMOL_Rhmol09G0143300 [Rhododendron molle]|uniref:Uncharacterized protein n=1 Tax=Rhododendron molle TaxID=49168 RepID=A0ACC0MD19_RHOML|nr:hypothetical protein RHMOL_Rhmol09G0143300 [Rhododendron molle]
MKKSNPMLETKHCFAPETAIGGLEQGNTVGEQNRPELVPKNPNNYVTVENPQEVPPTPPSTIAVLTSTTHQTLTTLLSSPPKPLDLGETQTSTSRI